MRRRKRANQIRHVVATPGPCSTLPAPTPTFFYHVFMMMKRTLAYFNAALTHAALQIFLQYGGAQLTRPYHRNNIARRQISHRIIHRAGHRLAQCAHRRGYHWTVRMVVSRHTALGFISNQAYLYYM